MIKMMKTLSDAKLSLLIETLQEDILNMSGLATRTKHWFYAC